MEDESHFLPQLFMDARVFRQRIEYLVRKRYPILPLGEAVERLRRKELPACATVITFDDGFYSIWKMAVPILREFDLPATIYVTTYYSVNRNPVFRLVVQYMFGKTTKDRLDWAGLGLRETGTASFLDAASRHDVAWRIINYAENQMNEHERVRLSRELGVRLGVDYAEIVDRRFLSLMTDEEIRQATMAGVDIQLHTHRHRLPVDAASVYCEIAQNREVLGPLIGRKPRHLAYPSGIYAAEHRDPLVRMDVISATTCDKGFNSPETPALALHRFVDANTVPQVVFEAEQSGFASMARRARSLTLRFGGDGGT
jgi:peptidoglycan/xylan/chitin deacetylase (PgdA/CDA1 family)